MKILVVDESYPEPQTNRGSIYVKNRCDYYKKNNIDVFVLSFSAKETKYNDGIQVLCYKDFVHEYGTTENVFDIGALHAPNIRHHYHLVIKRFNKCFKNFVFFFHGQEILNLSKAIPFNFPFIKKSIKEKCIRRIYDVYKLNFWKKKLMTLLYKTDLVFVSNTLYEEFLEYVKINEKLIKNNVHIIHNSIAKNFENNDYDSNCEKRYDFITIRGGFDHAKYGIDIVNQLAKRYPHYKFLIIGLGEYFKHDANPANLTIQYGLLNFDEIIQMANMAKIALMPTRWDSHGLMASELATFGMPLITSDIKICREIYKGFENAVLIENNNPFKDFEIIVKNLKPAKEKNKKFFAENTMANEVELFNSIFQQ